MIDIGKGSPLVLVPGIQGRWEWMTPAIEALAARSRVISYSLCGDRGSGCELDEVRGFENFASQLDAVLDRAGLRQAALCGVSFGGLIAVHYAACRPDRVNALVLVSTPGPRWRPDRRLMRYMWAPRLFAPLFGLRSMRVAARERIAALPRLRDRWRFNGRHMAYVLRAPVSPTRMAQRIRFALAVDFAADCRRITAPTLVVTGEQELDRIVGIETTRDYLACIPGARHAVFERTGHLGLVTQPARFAEIVCDFVEAVAEGDEAERGAGAPAIQKMIRHIHGPAGRLEALVDEPEACTASPLGADEQSAGEPSAKQPKVAVVLAHPHPQYGGTMHTKVVFQAAKAFCRIGCAVLRFNFRGAGASEGSFDNGPGELADFRRALDYAASRYPGAELWAAGMSFGAWVALTVGAEDDRVAAVLGIAPPLQMYDFGALLRSTKPKFFIQGERDELCPLKDMREFYARLPEPKELIVIETADHLFEGHAMEVGEAIEDLFEGFTATR